MNNKVESKTKELLRRLLSLRNLVPTLTIVVGFISTLYDKPFGMEREQLMLGLLTFLAIDALIERLDLLTNIEEDIRTLKELIPSKGVIFEKFPSELHPDLERAREIWLTGIHPYSTIERYYPLFARKIKEGDSIRVLVVDPNGAVCEMSAMRFSGKATGDQERTHIISTLNQLCELKREAPHNLEIRTIDYLLGYGVILLDPKTDHGVAYVRRYTFKAQVTDGIITPKSVYRPKDGRLYDLVCTETQELWKNGTPWECP